MDDGHVQDDYWINDGTRTVNISRGIQIHMESTQTKYYDMI